MGGGTTRDETTAAPQQGGQGQTRYAGICTPADTAATGTRPAAGMGSLAVSRLVATGPIAASGHTWRHDRHAIVAY